MLVYCQLDHKEQISAKNLIEIWNFSFTKMHLKVWSAKWRPFGPGEDELTWKFVTHRYVKENISAAYIDTINRPYGREFQNIFSTAPPKVSRPWNLLRQQLFCSLVKQGSSLVLAQPMRDDGGYTHNYPCKRLLLVNSSVVNICWLKSTWNKVYLILSYLILSCLILS